MSKAQLKEIDDMIAQSDRMIAADFEAGCVGNYENIAVTYNEIGDFENSRMFFQKMLDCWRLDASFGTDVPWFWGLYNKINTMYECSNADSGLKDIADNIAEKGFEEFGYKVGSVCVWVNLALSDERISEKEASELVEKMLTSFDVGVIDDLSLAYELMRDVYFRLHKEPTSGPMLLSAIEKIINLDDNLKEDFTDRIQFLDD